MTNTAEGRREAIFSQVRTYTKDQIREWILNYPGEISLSDNFTLSEFLKSQTASRDGIDNTPDGEVVWNLYMLCKTVLQPIRNKFGKPVSISSGYRSPELNTRIRGSKSSQHMTGMAADFEIFGLTNYDVCDRVSQDSNLEFDQLILEFVYANEPGSGWVHISYDEDKPNQRRSMLTINRHGTFNGLHLHERSIIPRT